MPVWPVEKFSVCFCVGPIVYLSNHQHQVGKAPGGPDRKNRTHYSTMSTADALVAVSDMILDSVDLLNKVEFNKKGRKYKLVNDNFQRVREEDKHLIIDPQNPQGSTAAILAYYILSRIGSGKILEQFPDFCLSIIGVAQELERKGWYEEENSSVVNIKHARYNPMEVRDDAIEYVAQVNDSHIAQGLDIMIASKLNFLHTDHHIGLKLDSVYIKNFVEQYYGLECTTNPDILVALKSFVHWGNTKGILHKLEVPNVWMTDELLRNFDLFPEPSPDLKEAVYDRFPSGTSKYSLIRRAFELLYQYQYAALIPFPRESVADLETILGLCYEIETDPIRYHLRSVAKKLCHNPVNLNDLSQNYAAHSSALLSVISLILNTFENCGDFLLQNSKIPKLTMQLINSHRSYYDELQSTYTAIKSYEDKNWDANDIVLRLLKNSFSIVDAMDEASNSLCQ